ncbi:MAG: glutamate--tRNA ligase [Mycoplasma sp.]
MKIRTRYAPSPTGYFHIGGARTALYNYLFAKRFEGDFIVRIEDTDIERNVENGTESQLDNIEWLGISPNESPLNPGNYGPYKQSEKLDVYEKLANQLVEEGKAYFCFCSKEKLDKDRELAELNKQTPKYNRTCLKLTKEEITEKLESGVTRTIRLKMKDNHDYSWKDLVRGEISVPSSALTDPVILKSNKIAMYNFAVVVDDYDMDITHVLRGEEHISNTPYQIAIKEALGFDKKDINYGHLSVIINDSGKKLSKRDTGLKQFISDYNEMGYLPIAVVNFLALLGWVPNDNKEVMTLDEMASKFDLANVGKSPAKFDITKMNWLGNQHFKKMDNNQFLEFVNPFVKSTNEIYLKHKEDVILLFKPQLSYAGEIDSLIEDLFNNNISKELIDEAKESIEAYKVISPMIIEYINSNDVNDESTFKQMIDHLKNNTGLKGKDLFMPIRILCTTKSHGPELAKTLYLLGKEKIISNVNLITKELKI